MSKEFKMGFIEEVEPLKLTTIPKKYQKLIEATENRWFKKMQKLAKMCQKRIDDLEQRLANCIEPKFKKGDKIYANTVAYWEKEKPVRHTTEQEIEEIVYFYKLKNYDFKNWDIDEIFLTEEEAKAKLEKIKNG